MKRVVVDKIGSSSKNVPLRKEIRVSEDVIAKEGYLVCGRVIGQKTSYNTLEGTDGRMMALHDGDIVVGVLGHRNALHGYSGVVPDAIKVGDRLNILNLGGVIGKCTSANPQIGAPFEVEILGSVLVFPELAQRKGIPAHIGMNSIAPTGTLEDSKSTPIVIIAGTCMNSGKTFAASEIIRHFHTAGLRVAGCKLSGVSLLRDTLNMFDHGAEYTASFNDAGIVTTNSENSNVGARKVLQSLLETDAHVIVAELGDGIMGTYGVQDILSDKAIQARTKAIVLCANDPVGAWGGQIFLEVQFKIKADVVSGPVTDHDAGAGFISEKLGVPGINAVSSGKKLAEFLKKKVGL
ncbi:MAG: hypothetical protein JST12_09920 [Armatimonadetes bacterium]|nr:hypothetical protein [Armatimonadota bacterium]